MSRTDRFQKLALSTTVLTYLLIGVGGLVRASGAGLGCPDWPLCFGLLVPPWSPEQLPSGYEASAFNAVKTWTEYLNRLLGALVGLFILATTALAVVDHRNKPRVLWPTTAAFALVLVTGWLGGQVVKTGLNGLVLTAHLSFALLVVSLLLYATVGAYFPAGPRPSLTPSLQRLVWASLIASFLVLAQVAAGAFLRSAVQEVADTGVVREDWLSQVGLIEVIHTNLSVVVTGSVVVVAYLAFCEGDRWMKTAAAAATATVLIQAGAGYGLVGFGFPRALQVVHLVGASLLMGALSWLTLLGSRLDPRFSQS